MRNWGLVAVVAALVAAAASVALSAGAGTAEAYPKRVCEGGTCRMVCRQKLPNGTLIDHEEGTSITATDTKGVKRKFKCTNGEWVLQRAVAGARTFDFPTRK